MTISKGDHLSTFVDNSNTSQRIHNNDSLELQLFHYTDHSLQDMEHDIDLDTVQ